MLRRLPTFPLPYVVNVAPKVLPEGYRYAVAIPAGKKVVVWCTYRDGTDDDMCYLLKSRGQKEDVPDDPMIQEETVNNNHNNNNEEAKLFTLLQEWPFPRKEQPVYLAKGSLAYGTYHDPVTHGGGTVILEDLLWYAGVDVRPFALDQKQRLMMDWIDRWSLHDKLPLALPHGAEVASLASAYQLLQQGTVYPVHHLEVRSTHGGRPHLLLQPQSQHREQKDRDKEKEDKVPFVLKKAIVYRKHKPQYKLATVFDVLADTESDLYHLYCASSASASASSVYCGLAGVPTLATSRWLQRLFAQTSSNKRRKVVPSTYCPDEDSDPDDDDEEEKENENEKETNDTVTKLRMECWFHGAFQKWVPRRVVAPTTPLVDVNRL